ncbi:hypothetical protein P6P90_00190 [Ectobacillus antri]|jgi:hypothetical protein|uniref:Uncharacterized protein n=1 Tax=Ectobacillus antri TaxID=2486280 RepID=A0ABT6H0W8_9BACI|nr:hypothetical protein [Ectobacillus antri]MDG4655743.1 hypothetical protein [Ectobacillus antri]MDG5752418.1 hypothetical protein [Ectobacillus antri]
MFLVICITACCLSLLLTSLFHNTIIPYIPSLLYALGSIYFLWLHFYISDTVGKMLCGWAVLFGITALLTFCVSAWMEEKRTC